MIFLFAEVSKFMAACISGFFSRAEQKKEWSRVTTADETCPFGALYMSIVSESDGLRETSSSFLD